MTTRAGDVAAASSHKTEELFRHCSLSTLPDRECVRRLRPEASLPTALTDYRPPPFVAGEAMTGDVAADRLYELSALGGNGDSYLVGLGSPRIRFSQY